MNEKIRKAKMIYFLWLSTQ